MVQTANQQETIQTIKGKIISIYENLVENKDYDQAEKIKQLAKKMENGEYTIAFCGHFSAGKSTMINRLIGENLLPSSPIPTSANLVKVKTGEEYAKVIFKNEKPRIYLAPYDYELVKNYCKDGDQIQEIEISHSDSVLPANTVIMDTPGIDSADDAHRIATESALHLADLIFYVMDYNHVQAELNFLFTKELTEAGKEVYLVINQIDKHKDEELSFHDFQKSVVDSFYSWGVKPARIFYTSLKNPSHSFNEFNELQEFISNKLKSKDQLLVPSVLHSLKKIARDHLYHARKIEEEALQPILEPLNELTEDEKKEITNVYRELQVSLQTITEEIGKTEKDFDQEIAKILKNAYLMPFQTRELAEVFLESLQPEFKVGFLFSKQKTHEEKNARLGRFYEDMVEKTKSQLEWHLREYLLRVLKDKVLDQNELPAKAQSFSIQISTDLLVDTVKPGARISGEYVLHYTEDVANEIKKMAREEIAGFKVLFLKSLGEKTAKQKELYDKEFARIEHYITALTELNTFEQRMKLKEKRLEELLTQVNIKQDDHNHLFSQAVEEVEVIKGQAKMREPGNETAIPKVSKSSSCIQSQNEKIPHENDHLKQMIDRLHKSSKLINNLPGFQKLGKELEEKAGRLENKGFTVALFGAFSAGKSSFANALMGEKVLPVSPNPTTAAINKIKPVTETYQHGTVLVKFKEAAAMLEDLNRSLKVFDLQAVNFEEASKKIDLIMVQQGQEGVLEKTHFAFLQAFNRGFDPHVKQLGTVMETDLNEFSDFVAKEEKSCFIEWIELYYDCELTRKGVTLVDTPGADSINARHTGVAFEYIKNSDAILFVTYYNHAFSKADREFLIQLGRVKDSFQMDKMFFIINAIDLADSEEEKETVSAYVKEQLVKYGIRNPHLFSLSSLLAINEKIQETKESHSGMFAFERAFYQFISNDLTEMAINAAGNELRRVQELVIKLIHNAQENKTIKEQKRLDIEQQKTMIEGLLEKADVESLQNRLFQESEELIFYIKQRVFLRFNDFFKEAFNPATLRDDGRNLKKAVQTALDEFLESLGFDFAQEMRATTVRLDRFAEKLLSDYQKSFIHGLHEINEDLSYSNFETEHEGKIDFDSAFKNINKQSFSKALSYFKNPRSFFEKNEKKFMSDALYNTLSQEADEYLSNEKNRMNSFYAQVLTNEFNRLLTEISVQTEHFYLSLLSALDGGVSLDQLIQIQQKLEGF
ncbi:dynamin family protein [Neobacillus ginsengisoli]|uniref:Small GTP-binding protein n=1 Tax=Neobacillus ginsengisoli TaxID=904295 RepID=A0ABT9XQP5_9BACI|nr:dynamin family protein [Neobacillus ginsengisoli]MDQ0197580.1 small GTP-binding protein [Neobacillus ginsengisoli]